MSKNQGFMLYHNDLHAIETLPDADFKRVVLALLSLSETGERCHLDGAANMAFSFMAEKVARDIERYTAICEKNSEKGKKSAAKRTTTVDSSQQ